MDIENTQTPDSMHLTAALLLATGDTDAVIGQQERAGQRQVVHSACLPTELRSPREEFETLGFTFGQPDPHDPLFTPTTLPDGWKKEASDHDMWSYVLDQHGRRRVGVFYKAAFYDRHADMYLIGLSGYVTDRLCHDEPIVTDDTWATREAVAGALRDAAVRAQKDVDTWQDIADRNGPDDTSRGYIAEYSAKRDRYAALADEYTD